MLNFNCTFGSFGDKSHANRGYLRRFDILCLSNGENQPRLIFLDEPTNGLDPPARKRMLELIREIRDSGLAHIVLSSHLLRDVEECCDEILILKNGNIAANCNL